MKTWKVEEAPLQAPVSDKPADSPTEIFCHQFENNAKKVKFFTIGSPMKFGNPSLPTTGAYGDVLGLFNHVGLNAAANSVMNESVRKASNFVGNLLPEDNAPPNSFSKPKGLPSWWKE